MRVIQSKPAGRVPSLMLALAASGLASAHAQGTVAPSLLGQLQFQPNGTFALDDIHFQIEQKSWRWAPAWQRDLTVNPGYPVQTATGFQEQGTFKTDSGPYALTENLAPGTANSVTYTAELSGTPTQASRLLNLSIGLPIEEYKGQTLLLDQTKLQLPWWFKGQGLLNGYQHVRALSIPLKSGGTLVLQGDLQVYCQDNREYNAPDYDLEIGFAPHDGTIPDAKLTVTLSRVAVTGPLGAAFDATASRPPRTPAKPNRIQNFAPDPTEVKAALARVSPLPPLHAIGQHFVDAAGHIVRFWGMNLVAFYPDHALADATADHLASLGINMVRPHHDLRPSADWDPADCDALVTYDADSRTPNLKAWDHYDYLNAKLREKGIYLAISMHGTRQYMPQDVSILHVSAQDDEAWADAVDELNHWTWQKSFDPRKELPVIDERSFLLNAEFATNYLTHVNPYTGFSYAKDSQVVSIELINEFSTEYTLVCGNQFPDYWTRRINALLAAYETAHGAAPFPLYGARTPAQKRLFSAFCNDLDATYERRMEKVIRNTGYTGAIEFSNLWRGDANLRQRASFDGVIEDHTYTDPLVVKDPDNFLYSCTKSAVAGKPVIIGELNQSEGDSAITANRAVLSMLPVATAAYGSLQDYSGFTWFAWTHGQFRLGADGWGKPDTNLSDSIGTLAGNSTILDFARACGIIFKNGYLLPSASPQTVYVTDDYAPTNYNEIMAGQTSYQPGWQAVHGFRKAFGASPESRQTANWMTNPPPNPAISDTGQIVRDSARRQLTFSAPNCEGFSGYLDGAAPAKLAALNLAGTAGFASAVVVSLDDRPLSESAHLLVCRAYTDPGGAPSTGLQVTLQGLKAGSWRLITTRITGQAPSVAGDPGTPLAPGLEGALALPVTNWSECELTRMSK